MKILKIVSVVFVFHVLAIVLLMVQPGCKTVESGSSSSGEKNSAMNAFEPSDQEIKSQEPQSSTIANNRYMPRRPANADVSEQTERSKPGKPEVLAPITSVKEVSMNALIEQPKVAEPESTEYIVKSGDSLWVISKRFNVPMVDIMEMNGMNKQSVLKVGQKLKIPGVAASSDKSKGNAVAVSSTEGVRYKVRNGDTLSGIANRFHVSMEDIKVANNMKSSVIYAGKEIIIPGATEKTAKTEQPSLASAKNDAPKVANINMADAETHVVEPGESLSTIATTYGVSVNSLKEMNNISDPRRLRVGQTLVVKAKKDAPKAIPQINTQYAEGSETSPAAANVLGSESEKTAPRVIGEAKVEMLEETDDALFELDEEIPVVQVDKVES